MTERSGTGDVHRSLALLWPEGAQRSSGSGRLSVERIVNTAIRIADTEGLESVSMRRIAAALEVGTMSLYRYVPGKEELLDLMLDRVLGEDLPPYPQGWRATLEHFGRETWELYRKHTWLPFVDQSRPILGPRALAGLEVLLAGLEGTPWTSQEKILAVTTIEHFVASLARTVNGAELAEERSGVSSEDFWQAQEPILVRAMESGRYPLLAAMAEDAFGAGPEESFEFGLVVVLDGLAASIERRGARHTDD